MPDAVVDFPLGQLIDGMNRFHAARHPGLHAWMLTSRLDGYLPLRRGGGPGRRGTRGVAGARA
ncbi:MAG: hypothetical protein MZW92_00250 [Comamonadaceae bacterium]|nr:hypothetical protein [Comamonadaceae bacterium]